MKCKEELVVAGHQVSLLPEGKNFRLIWHDEFDGTRLDTIKWGFRTNFWGRKAHWFAEPKDGAIEIRDSICRLKLVKKSDGRFASPQLQTGELLWDLPPDPDAKGFWSIPKREPSKFMHSFGYYECRCRTQRKPGWWSAFWLQSPDQGATLDPARSGIETDIMESFEPGRYIVHAFHYNGYGGDYKRFNAQRAPYTPSADSAFKLSYPVSTDEFHRFGLLWEPDGYTVFVDGQQSGHKVGKEGDEAVSHAAQFILISTEAKWYRNNRMTGEGAPELEDAWKAGDSFDVDYVRVFDMVE